MSMEEGKPEEEKKSTGQATATAWKPGFKRRQEEVEESKKESVSSKIVQEAESELRTVLNKVSEGNIDPMFQKMRETFQKVMNKDKAVRSAYYEAYAKNFIVLAISQQQQMNQLLSVNCVFVAALHRLCGPAFGAKVIQKMFAAFIQSHQEMIKATHEGQEVSVMRIKNIMNCLVHLFLFQSIGSELLFDVIKFLL